MTPFLNLWSQPLQLQYSIKGDTIKQVFVSYSSSYCKAMKIRQFVRVVNVVKEVSW